MKYCTNCGQELKENARFCTNCGNPTRIEKEKILKEKQKKEENIREKILLNFGIVLVIFSSLLFALLSWDNFSDIFKIIFLSIESILFFLMAFVSKKIKSNTSFKACYLLGVIFIPLILYLANYYGLFGSYFYNEGAGLYVYLSIISSLCILLYYISYKFVGSKIYVLLSFMSFMLFIFNFVNIFSDSLNVFLTVILMVIFIFNILLNKDYIFKNEKNILNVALNIIFIVLIPIISIELIDYDKYRIFNLIITVLYILNLYIKGFLVKKNIFKYIIPFISIYVFSLYAAFSFEKSLALFLVLDFAILLHLLSLSNKDLALNIITTSILLITIPILLCLFPHAMYKVSLVLNITIVLFSFIMNRINKKEICATILKYVVPINIFFIVESFIRLFVYLNSTEVLLAASLVCFIIYLIDKKNNAVYEVYYIIYLFLSTMFIEEYPVFRVPILLNTLLWLFYYVINIVLKKNNLKYMFFTGTIISLLITLNYLHFGLYYILLGITLLMFLSYELSKKKNIFYLICGSVLILISILFDFSKYNILSIIVCMLLFIYSYFNIKNKEKFSWYRILHVFFGFLFIYKLLNMLIVPVVIVNILTLFIYLFVLIVMYLSESEKSQNIYLYSFMLLLPYYNLINNIKVLESIYQLNLVPFILYTLVGAELIKFKSDNSKQIFVFTLILLLSFGTISTSIESMIISILLTIIFLIYGIRNKMNMITYFSVIYFVISLILSLYKTYNNILIISLLLLFGIGIIVYIFIKETKSNKK